VNDSVADQGLPIDQGRADYDAIRAINYSGLKVFARSPAHYYAQYLDPNREPRVETPAMKLGSASHCAVLEPSEFEKRYVIAPDGLDRRTKDGKAAYAELEQLGKIILSAADYKAVQGVARSVRAHPAAGDLLGPGNAEVTVCWRDSSTGEDCKGRLDYLTESGFIVDLKTCEDAREPAFERAVATFGYHRQAAWYLDGVNANGPLAQAYMIVAVEKKPPFACAFYYFNDEALIAGRNANAMLLQRFSECRQKNFWPGYQEIVKSIGLPAWYQDLDIIGGFEYE
jgi:hypothetical protein